MTSEAEADLAKNFRASYYESLGFRGGEKSLSHLEGLLKAEILDVDKLKSFCLKHTLPAYYRPLVWKVLLGVVPIHSDEETRSFVKDQRQQQFRDMKRALEVMGRLTHPPPVLTSFSFSFSSPSSSSKPALPCPHSFSPEDFVLLHLLESNQLLSAAVSQLRQEPQINLVAIASVFIALFGDDETEAYWLFSKFSNAWLSRSKSLVENMIMKCFLCLEEADFVLYDHLKTVDPNSSCVPYRRWFVQCFAGDLPETCIETIWDKVLAGSNVIVVHVAVAVLLCLKRRLLGASSTGEIARILQNIPEDSCSLVVSKAVELWEDQGSLLATPDLTPDLTTMYTGTTATILSSRSSSSSAVLRDTDEIT